MKDNIEIIEKYVCPIVPFAPGVKPSKKGKYWCSVFFLSDSSYELDSKQPTDYEINKAFEKLF